MIQIRHVPEELHRKLKAKAAAQGISLSGFLLNEARRAADQPTLTEMMDRLARRPPVTLRTPTEAVIGPGGTAGDRSGRVRFA